MIFVFDLDDTICDTDAFSEKYMLEFFEKHNLPYQKIADKVRYAEQKFSWDAETAIAWYKEFGDELLVNFPCKKGTKEFLNKIHEQGHKIVIATARNNNWHKNPTECTFAWLANNKIPYDEVYIGVSNKEDVCEKVNADFFVDDDLEIIERVADFFNKAQKGKAFLITTDFNEELDVPKYAERILDFKELEKRTIANQKEQ